MNRRSILRKSADGGCFSVKRRETLAGLMVGSVLTLGGCGLMTSQALYRYRMHVQGVYSGSSVYEILAEKTNGPLLPDEKPGGSIIKGQALVMETPSGPVFVLLQPASSGNDLIGAITRALTPDIPWNVQPNFWKAVKRLSGAGDGAVKGDLPRADWPLMVRFRDINDPKSLEGLDSDAIGIRRVWVETTRDPVTTGIERRIPWIDHLDQYLTDPRNPFTSTLPENFGGFRS